MSAAHDDLLKTILDIAMTGANRSHVSHEFARAARLGEAEMESEFEADDYTKADYLADEADSKYDGRGL